MAAKKKPVALKNDGILVSPAEEAGQIVPAKQGSRKVSNPNAVPEPTEEGRAELRAKSRQATRRLKEFDAANPNWEEDNAKAVSAADRTRRRSAKVDVKLRNEAIATPADTSAKVADRTRKGAPKEIDAPAPRKFSTGRVAKASPVETTAAKRPSSARAVQRRAQEIAGREMPAPLASDPKIGAELSRRRAESMPDDSPVVIDNATNNKQAKHNYYLPRYGEFLRHLSDIDNIIGEGGSKLPASASPELRRHAAGLVESARTDHATAYAYAVKRGGFYGDINSALTHANTAHETLQSLAYLMHTNFGDKGGRGSFSNTKLNAAVVRHGDTLKGAYSDQERNSKDSEGNPQWSRGFTKLGNEKFPITGSREEVLTVGAEGDQVQRIARPFVGQPRDINPGDKLRDARSPRRGHSIKPFVDTASRIALAHDRSEGVVRAVQNAQDAMRNFGDAVAGGDREQIEQHGRALMGHLGVMHTATHEAVRRTAMSPQARETVLNTFSRNITPAIQRVKEILGEKTKNVMDREQ